MDTDEAMALVETLCGLAWQAGGEVVVTAEAMAGGNAPGLGLVHVNHEDGSVTLKLEVDDDAVIH